jgi:hypothetical protein
MQTILDSKAAGVEWAGADDQVRCQCEPGCQNASNCLRQLQVVQVAVQTRSKPNNTVVAPCFPPCGSTPLEPTQRLAVALD